MRVAVTGSTGFLGRFLVAHRAQSGHHLRCWYRPESDRGGLEAFARQIEWIPGRLGDAQASAALIG